MSDLTIEEMTVPKKLEALFAQSRQIERINDRLRDLVFSGQMIDFYVDDLVNYSDDRRLEALVARAKEQKSYPIVFYELKEYVDGKLRVLYPGQGLTCTLLESKNELENNPTNWLRIDDMLAGFSGTTNDFLGPRYITDITPSGCCWRYVAQPEMEPREPRYDKFFQRRDWVRIDLSSETWEGHLDDAWYAQDEELVGLNSLYEYINNREFIPVEE